jgi:hypothetical protein
MTINQHTTTTAPALPGAARARAHDEMRPGRPNPRTAEAVVADAIPAETSWDEYVDESNDVAATVVVDVAPTPERCWHRTVLSGLSMSRGMGNLKPEFVALMIVLSVLLVALVTVMFLFVDMSR